MPRHTLTDTDTDTDTNTDIDTGIAVQARHMNELLTFKRWYAALHSKSCLK